MHPDSELHIYYIEGKVRPDAVPAKSAFVGNWQEDGFSFLFYTEEVDARIAELTAGDADLHLLDRYQMTYADWQGGRVSTTRIGSFCFIPPWQQKDTGVDPYSILLDPGVVFGTGTHPTTRDCLDAMEIVFAQEQVQRMVDCGTGTGVLALAGARLGCPRTVAVDFNFLAAKTTLENVRHNHMEEAVFVINATAEDYVGLGADLLVANIHWDVMRRLLHCPGFLDNRWLILSGLLRSEARALADFLVNRPVSVVRRWEEEGVWHTFLCRTDQVTGGPRR